MSHYFTEPSATEKRRSVDVRFWDTEWQFTTANEVFSADGLDLGTSVLLRESSPPAGATRLLDLGCGWGVIAVALAAACPDAVVDAVDVNPRALALTADNARAHGVGDRVRPSAPHEVDDGVRYDELWSNPPIRIGKGALHGLVVTWLSRPLPRGGAGVGGARSSSRVLCSPVCPRSSSAGWRVWWSAASWAPTPCSGGWSSRAGNANGSPARRASGCSRCESRTSSELPNGRNCPYCWHPDGRRPDRPTAEGERRG